MNIKEFYSICKTEKNLKGYIWQNNYDQFEKKLFSNENLLNFYFGNGNWEVNINQSDLENYKSFLLNFENINSLKFDEITKTAELDQKKINLNKNIEAEYLYKYFYSHRINRIYKDNFNKEIETIIEIGGGIGTLARSFFQEIKIKKYVLIDIPETLILAYQFLGRVLDKKILLTNQVSKDEFQENDIILLSPINISNLKEFNFDILINTNSFGEFPYSTFLKYIEELDECSNIKSLYSLNRFMNRIRRVDLNPRLDHLGHVFSFPKKFLIQNFCPDPNYERFDKSNYAVRSRNLELFLTNSNNIDLEKNIKISKKKFEELILEDKFKENNFQLNTRSDYVIINDYEIKHTLTELFNYYHMTKDKYALKYLLIYFLNAGGIMHPFEEVYFMIKKIENLNQKDSIIKSLDIFVCKYFNERDYREYISYYINENNFSNLSVRKIINKFILFNSRFILIILRRILKKLLNLK